MIQILFIHQVVAVPATRKRAGNIAEKAQEIID